jgi:hypothetical protein
LQEILLAIWVGSSPCEKYQVIKHKYFDGSKEVKDNIAKKKNLKITMSCLDPCKKATAILDVESSPQCLDLGFAILQS